MNIFKVDGDEVREKLFIDYTEGSHDLVYDWIPHNEIWIEDMKSDKFEVFNVVYEIMERDLMIGKKYGYDPAHERAAKAEEIVRNWKVRK